MLVEIDKTIVWLAEQLGLSPVTVSKWCSNITPADTTDHVKMNTGVLTAAEAETPIQTIIIDAYDF